MIENDAETLSQVVVGDASLLSVLRAGQPLAVRTTPDDQLRIVVPLRNIDDEQIQVLTQIAFFDAQRRPLPDETNRQVITLAPGSTVNIESVSRSKQAADFVVRVTWNK
ncbi:hypothetical protein LBMAG49_15630 [Planctomycetota bacterium]|nr:hypothetical protein LBMAG49_15630 [Planctomycetota bacterium]